MSDNQFQDLGTKARAQSTQTNNTTRRVIDDLRSFTNSDFDDVPVNESIDALFELTGVDRNKIPASEAASVSKIIENVVKYLSLRGKDNTNNFDLINDSLYNLTKESTVLTALFLEDTGNSQVLVSNEDPDTTNSEGKGN